MTGTLVNILAILAGSLGGVLLGHKLPQKIKDTVMHALGLSTLLLGLSMALKSNNQLIVIGSLLLGGVFGEILDLEEKLNRIGQMLERRFSKVNSEDSTENKLSLSKAFVTATLVFCIGPLSILGAMLDGMTGNSIPLFIKSVLDGFAALAFAASMGIGVIFSAVTVGVYQGSISLISIWFSEYIGNVSEQSPAIIEMSATGGMLIVGIGLVLLDIKALRLANFLPALAFAPVLVYINSLF